PGQAQFPLPADHHPIPGVRALRGLGVKRSGVQISPARREKPARQSGFLRMASLAAEAMSPEPSGPLSLDWGPIGPESRDPLPYLRNHAPGEYVATFIKERNTCSSVFAFSESSWH